MENDMTTPMGQLLGFIRSYLSSTHISNEQRELADLIRKKIETFYLPLETEHLNTAKNVGAFEEKQKNTVWCCFLSSARIHCAPMHTFSSPIFWPFSQCTYYNSPCKHQLVRFYISLPFFS